MADVHRAFDTKTLEEVAIKLFTRGRLDDAIIAEAFRREVRALSELRHPGIVRLRDAGIDPATEQRFLALDWVQSDITSLARPAFKTWNGYFADLGGSILDALAFAHSRGVVHRDIKPQNVLRDESGVFLADFGVSKLKSWLEPSLTLQQFGSAPFSAPEANDGAHEYARDVFSYAALSLQCLASKQFIEYSDVLAALDDLDAPDDVHSLLQRCLSAKPEDRPINAQVLLSNLRALSVDASQRKARRLYLTLTKKVIDALAYGNLRTRADIEDHARREFSGESVFETYDLKEESQEKHFQLFGATLSCHIALRDDGCTFALIGIREISPNKLEQCRERGYATAVEIRFSQPPDVHSAKVDIIELIDAITEHEKARRAEDQLSREESILGDWSKLLSLKEEIEKDRQRPLQYSSVIQNGNRYSFTLLDRANLGMIGEKRIIESDGRVVFEGDIESLDGGEVTLYATSGRRLTPNRGVLLLGDHGSREGIKRQRAALSALRNERSVRRNLKDLLIHPDRSEAPVAGNVIELINSELDHAKVVAVDKAIGVRDFLLVEGPPGTGKTTFITEAVMQILRANGSARILIASQTHVALDNVLENLQGALHGGRAIRIAREDNERVAASVRGLLLGPQAELWASAAAARGRKFLESWAGEAGISENQFAVSSLLRELSAIGDRKVTIERELETLEKPFARIGPLSDDDGVTVDEVDNDDLASRIVDLRKELRALSERRIKGERALCEIEPDANELVSKSPADLQEWAETFLPSTETTRKYRTLVDLQAAWHLRLARAGDFEEAVIAASQVVAGTCVGLAAARGIANVDFDYCIVDEASKATPTELLVPLVRAHRIILVGDTKQLPPFIEDDLRERLLKSGDERLKEMGTESLFARLNASLPGESMTMLSEQHRMVPQIGNLISHCFYNDRLKSKDQKWEAILKPILSMPSTWLDTSKRKDREEDPLGTGYRNPCEAAAITKLLGHLEEVLARRAHRHVKALIISGYKEQINEVNRAIAPLLPSFQWLDIECNTVDAVQGRQADMVIYSVVRSNPQGNLGFLREPKRLNVALSRGRQHLVIIGDQEFCKSARGENPFYSVANYFDGHLDTCKVEFL